ncbi:MAG TPA: c-type cytochrome [Haliscomenobacter sp.]|uniref:c-type cytochrome n=1 Tax=Haliscomenobacter sp. TaxID=2717303 RepID=UPI002B8DB50C|nr:c-type cytochrome [Haliscomenobacter sp.]HOY20475.1 c-type cytochrome [Haliscomenobacter sp.]
MKKEGYDSFDQGMLSIIQQLISAISVLMVGLILLTLTFVFNNEITSFLTPRPRPEVPDSSKEAVVLASSVESFYWTAPDIANVSDQEKRAQINYGKQLIAHTAKYLGPKGSVKAISNGMNCQNCHLEAGTKIFGNNYGSVASTYPKFRARSGAEEDIYKRVNDCFERSLNGSGLAASSKEMQAIKAYIEFLGKEVPKGEKAEGSGLKELPFLDRAADAVKGKLVYVDKCQSCHQANGAGLLNAARNEYVYPPLWGKNSYNDGAGLYRVSNFAKYAKYNMPLGVHHSFPQLSDEEAWDVAAFVNSQSRPHKDVPKDWPDIAKKPIDHPFGPYADGFSEQQHKYGPFQPIAAAQQKQAKGR